MISRIQKFYRYFVYRIYHINNNDPEMKVMMFICMVHCSLTLSSLIILDIIFNIGYPHDLDKSEWTLLVLLFFSIQFLIFFRPSKWKTYFKEFENESKEEKRKGTILVWGYIIFSMFSPIYIPVIWDAFFR